ncbi:MAG TPA: ABC transporter substrate-binding protein [Azospirillum sp.]|nr:ABC transporter substrate-binding protein [Azospirillum sp.]
MRIVFFNPGKHQVDAGWTQQTRFMQAAADQFGLRLEVFYADRDRIKMVEQAKAVAARPVPPDYVVLVNEKQKGAEMLELFRGSNARLLLIHNDLTAEQRRVVGDERGRLSNWIGTLVSEEHGSARAMMAELYRRSASEPRILGIGGDEATPVSKVREDGVRSFVAEAGYGMILQIVPGNWTRGDAKAKALRLLARYPDATVIWAANDTMALGAHDAVVELKKQGTVVVGGLGAFTGALDSVRDGGMTVTVGGGTLASAWAVVLIHDYHRGYDFATIGGPRLNHGTVAVVNDARSATRFRELADHPSRVDFRRFSRAENPALKGYDFRYDAVVGAMK